MKALGKKKLLGILTAAAIVVTAVGSFAVWDQLEDNVSDTITLGRPVTVQATMAGLDVATANGEGEPTYEGTVSFAVDKGDLTDYTGLSMNVTGTVAGTAAGQTDLFQVTATPQAGAIVSATTVYDIVVAPKQNLTAEQVTAIAGDTLTVDVTGTLTKAP